MSALAAAQPRAVNDFQSAQQIFQPLVANGTLQRVWRFFALGQRWLFYDPRPSFLRFNTLRTVNVASDPPAILLVNSTRQQRFRGYTLFEGWNFVLIEAEPPSPRPGRNIHRVEQVVGLEFGEGTGALAPAVAQYLRHRQLGIVAEDALETPPRKSKAERCPIP